VLLEIIKPYAPPPVHLFETASASTIAPQSSVSGTVSSKYAQAVRSGVDPQLLYLDSKSKSSMQDVVITKPEHSEWGFSLAKQIITSDMDVSSFSAATCVSLPLYPRADFSTLNDASPAATEQSFSQ
jgi:hypothetical protein